MDYDYSDLVTRAKSWAQTVINAGWCMEHSLRDILTYEQEGGGAENLFKEDIKRPLMVAFLGGTGVGKSSLLNRLAGEAIARSGEIRPTSKEVTIFHHSSVALQYLPKGLPIDKVKIATHHQAAYQHIMWIDMPDFDSVEYSNQQLVLEWLPYIDVLVYVVSPERYRDHKAWQLLQKESGKHAWLFAFNQCDRGVPEQYDDFIKQLSQAKFNDPLVYKTCCINNLELHQYDNLKGLEVTIQTLANDKTIAQLALHQTAARKEELAELLEYHRMCLGDNVDEDTLLLLWKKQWSKLEEILSEENNLIIKQLAQYYAEHSVDIQKSKEQHERLWDSWAQSRFMDSLDQVIYEMGALSLPVSALKIALQPLQIEVKAIIVEKTLLSVRKALINPGNIVQRLLLKIVHIAAFMMPLMAMIWVGYHVFIRFYSSSLEAIPHYLGVDFAVNSAMLVGISWLLPYFLQKKMQPSLEKSALKGLQKGFCEALQVLDYKVQEQLSAYSDTRIQFSQQLEVIIDDCYQVIEQDISGADKEVLRRMTL